MTIRVPEKLVTYWNAMAGDFPPLLLRYTENSTLPQATYRAEAFGRDYENAGFRTDIHRYEIAIISDSAEVAFDLGTDAAELLVGFAPPGTEMCTVQPAQWATPMKQGQTDVWCFKINLEIRIVPA